jgi:hypothetical protein
MEDAERLVRGEALFVELGTPQAPDLRHAAPQLVTERAAFRLVIEQGYRH